MEAIIWGVVFVLLAIILVGLLWFVYLFITDGFSLGGASNYSSKVQHGQAAKMEAELLDRFNGSGSNHRNFEAQSPSAPKPGPLLHPTPENFEEYCRDWCIYLGYAGATKTQNSRDGGIDIKAHNMIAQVKFQVSPIGVRPIRELNGVRRQGQEVLFFALNGYTPEARREASQMGITLVTVSPLEGQIAILA